MPLLQFETTEPRIRGDAAHGPEEAHRLERARDRMIEALATDFTEQQNLAPRLSDKFSFFAFPEQQLLAYEKHRGASELGRVFQIANGLHDHLDAIVIVGPRESLDAARALRDACCDPFHNELDRAARGSKPRVYFATPELDNDHLKSLLHRLGQGGYGDGPAEKTWAAIAIVPPDVNQELRTVLDLVIDALETQSTNLTAESRQRLLASIATPEHAFVRHMQTLGWHQALVMPPSIARGSNFLTPAGTLPAAFLGFDCIQLLVGAAAINANFRSQPFASNVPLQVFAASHPFASNEHDVAESDVPKSFDAWWGSGLDGLASWKRNLILDSNPLNFLCPAPAQTNLADPDALRRLIESSRSTGRPHSWVCNHVIVESVRTDPIIVGTEETGDASVVNTSLPELHQERFERARQELDDCGIRQTILRLPVIDTHTLGQFAQLQMIIESLHRFLD